MKPIWRSMSLVALLLSSGGGHASERPTPPAAGGPAAATPKTLALAEALVAAGDELQHEQQALEPLETMISTMVSTQLATADPAAAATVKAVVSQALAPAPSKAIEAMTGLYAANFSERELREILTFVNGPAGQAEKINLPLLKGELRAALSATATGAGGADDIDRALAKASPAKRQLILRILKAQDLEARTRKGYQALLGAMDGAAPTAAGPSSRPPTAAAQAVDDYVRQTMAVTARFYGLRFSEAQLAASADYLESEAGRAVLERMPIIQRAAGGVLRDQLVIALASLDAKVCAAVACSQDQRAAVAAFARGMAAQLSSAKRRD